ncbi:transposase [Streptomyces sp. NPDC058475]|uniref:transposase n=1 Tax=Streptomyces sp. NPDC058475 TaxID=3346518 RepID=UPI00364DC71B
MGDDVGVLRSRSLSEDHEAGELDWTRACVDGSHVRAKKGGSQTGPSPVDRRKTGSKHDLICDGEGTPLHVITTAANVNDITQTLDLVDGIPPVAGRPGRPRRRPECLLGDNAYDSKAVRGELRRRCIQAVISRKGSPNIKGLGKLRYVVEQTFALLHQCKHLAVRWNDVSNSTTRSSRWLAASSSGDVSRGPDHDRVTSHRKRL